MSKTSNTKSLDITSSEDSNKDAPNERVIHSYLEQHGQTKPGVADKTVQTSFELMCPKEGRKDALNTFKDVTETVIWKAKQKKDPKESELNIHIPKHPIQQSYEVKGELQAKPPHETYYKTRSKLRLEKF